MLIQNGLGSGRRDRRMFSASGLHLLLQRQGHSLESLLGRFIEESVST